VAPPAPDQPYQRLQRGLPVTFLRAMALRRDQHCALPGEPPAGELPQPCLHVVRQA